MTTAPITVEFGDPTFSTEALRSAIAEQTNDEITAAAIDEVLADDTIEVILQGEILAQLHAICLATGQTADDVISSALALYETYVQAKTAGLAVQVETAEGFDNIFGLFIGDE